MEHTMRFLWEKKVGNEVCLLRVYAETSDIVIPAYIENHPVTEIGSYCFSATEHLEGKQFYTTEWNNTSVQRLDSLVTNHDRDMEVGNHIKKENVSVLRTVAGEDLIKICLPDTIRVINNAAFYNCRKLESLEVGPDTKQIGSDVFTNCASLKQLQIRCRNYKAESAKALPSRISTELEVYYYETVSGIEEASRIEDKSYAKNEYAQMKQSSPVKVHHKKELFASLLYPEYFEYYDEIAPAHIFGKQIEGEGFRARQCFQEGKILFGEYDKIFRKAKAEETALTVGRMCMHRLLFPIELTKEVEEVYKVFLKENEQEIGEYFVKEKNKESIEYLFQQKLLSYAGIDTLVTCAAKLQWSEGTSFMLHLKHQCYEKRQKNTYEFEPL